MAAKVTRHDNGEIEILITLPKSEVASAIEKQIQSAVAETELPGFRKGKAPRSMVEPKLDKGKLSSQVIQQLLPKAYTDTVTTEKLKPILYPHIHINKVDPDQDWEFTLHTCEAPTINLPDYETEIKKIPTDPADTKTLRIIDRLRQIAGLKIPDMLVEEEANHRLSSLIENITRLGMTTESYLQAKKITPDNLKSQISTEARADLEAEFILSHLQTTLKHKDRKSTLDYLLALV